MQFSVKKKLFTQGHDWSVKSYMCFGYAVDPAPHPPKKKEKRRKERNWVVFLHLKKNL